MGTSTTYGGKKDRPPLLPDWALPAPVGPPEPVRPDTSQPELEPVPGESEPPPHPAAPSLEPEPTPKVGPLAGKPLWSRAGRALGQSASSGGTRGLGQAGRRYVRAQGGSGGAARSATSARRSTARFAGFLGEVSRNGFAAAFANLGLGALVGRDLDSVIAALNDALCPAGANREEIAAREAASEALEELFQDVIETGGDLGQLDAMSPEAIGRAIEAMVSGYIFNRWLSDLGNKIEEKAISPEQAVRTEQRMKEFIRDAVKIDFSQLNTLNVDWRTGEGRALVERIYQDAYAVIGGER